MYVKIIKCSEKKAWYIDMIDLIYPVIENENCKDDEYTLQIQGTTHYLKPSDCEIIDFDDGINKESASIQRFRSILRPSFLLSNTFICNKSVILDITNAPPTNNHPQ